MSKIIIYTDGGVQNNGKKDCYGACAYVILKDGLHLNENVEYLFNTTNNRAEIQGILNALHYLKDNRLHNNKIIVHSDSQYCVKGCVEWIYNWHHKKYLRDGKNIPNADLWRDMHELIINFNNLTFKWVKGHEDNEMNNYVNDLCTAKQDIIKNNLV